MIVPECVNVGLSVDVWVIVLVGVMVPLLVKVGVTVGRVIEIIWVEVLTQQH